MKYALKGNTVDAFIFMEDAMPVWFMEYLAQNQPTEHKSTSIIINKGYGKEVELRQRDIVYKKADGRVCICHPAIFHHNYRQMGTSYAPCRPFHHDCHPLQPEYETHAQGQWGKATASAQRAKRAKRLDRYLEKLQKESWQTSEIENLQSIILDILYEMQETRKKVNDER